MFKRFISWVDIKNLSAKKFLLLLGSLVFFMCCIVPLAIEGIDSAIRQIGLLPTRIPTLTSTITPTSTYTLTIITPTITLTSSPTIVPTSTITPIYTITNTPFPTISNTPSATLTLVHTKEIIIVDLTSPVKVGSTARLTIETKQVASLLIQLQGEHKVQQADWALQLLMQTVAARGLGLSGRELDQEQAPYESQLTT